MASIMHVAVIGAGVVGLSTALKVQEKGHSVTIVADALPGDDKSPHYTSPWAGAHHVSFADPADVRQQTMDRETFRKMWEMSAPEAVDSQHCFMRLPQTEYFVEPRARPHPLEVMPDFRYLEQSELIAEARDGVSFSTVTIDTAAYLPYLQKRFVEQGGKVIRSRIQHINQVVEGAFGVSKPDAVFVCAGLGARVLGGVEDKDVFPIRGQTVLVKAPWITFGRTLSSTETGLWTYIIPRRSGNVILGGVKDDHDWFPHPRPETTTDILERCLALCPELIPQESSPGTVVDLQSIIVESGCGFRPGRKGGIRLEVEWRERPSRAPKAKNDREVLVIHNYGHAGQGYQSSWGSASMALALFEEAIKSERP